MNKTTRNIISILLLLVLLPVHSQESHELRVKIDELISKWDEEALNLESYEGLSKFCLDKEYRYSTIDLLREIHHFDSVLYERALIAQQKSNDHEIKQLIKEIEKFEKKYSMNEFISFLRDECSARSDIEKHKEELKAEVAQNSYDSQVYLVELELQKYIHHITKRLDNIKMHVDHLIE